MLLALPGDEALARQLATSSGNPVAHTTIRQFPDGEAYVRIHDDVRGRAIWVVGSLLPAERFLALHMLAATAKDLGALRVGLIAPYLAYMRQDSRFNDGEGVTCHYFADLIGRSFDELICVDPHLHRRSSLSEVYSIPTRVVSAADAIAAWISTAAPSPVLVGPDMESAQWVHPVAEKLGVPSVILSKTRRGDRDVSVCALSGDDASLLTERMPIILDDIISTGKTMAAAVERVRDAGGGPPICIGTHAVFADDEVQSLLLASGAQRVVTCNTVGHASNEIDIVPTLADVIRASA